MARYYFDFLHSNIQTQCLDEVGTELANDVPPQRSRQSKPQPSGLKIMRRWTLRLRCRCGWGT